MEAVIRNRANKHSGVARLGHTGACTLATRGRAPPVLVHNQIVCGDNIVVDCKSGATLTIHKFAVSGLWYSLRTNLGDCTIPKNFRGAAPRPSLNAAALCAEVCTNVRSVPMLCPSIGGVLAMPLNRPDPLHCTLVPPTYYVHVQYMVFTRRRK